MNKKARKTQDPQGGTPPPPRDALDGKGPQRRPQQRLGRRLEEVAKAVGGGYCRLQIPLKLAFAVRGTVAGHRLGALRGGGGDPPTTRRNVTQGDPPPPFQCIPATPPPRSSSPNCQPIAPKSNRKAPAGSGSTGHADQPPPPDSPIDRLVFF